MRNLIPYFQNRALSNDEMRRRVPSIFAEAPIAGVSGRYSFLPTASVLESMRDAGWLPVDCGEQRVNLPERRGFQKHMLRFQRQEDIGTERENRGEVVLFNSHDRSCAYQIHAGIFRFVCANGLIVADETFERISIKHSGFRPETVIEGSLQVLDSIPQLMDSVEQMKARRLSLVERKALAIGAIAARWENPETAPVSADKVLEPHRIQDAGNDLYSTLNVVQENIIRGGQKEFRRRDPRTSRRFARTRGVKGLDENLRLNKALWHMAEALRKGDI